MSVRDLRNEYSRGELSEKTAGDNPIPLMQRWLDDAVASGVHEPNAMTLATADPDGQPSSRIVLLRGFSAAGLEFFTNYLSRKGREMASNPKVSLQFFWPALERQVRVEGNVSPLTSAESDAYFNARPLESRLGAVASRQSETLQDRATLEARVEELRQQFADGNVPRPEHWGGYRVVPDVFEFWQGRPGRLHDRLLFTRSDATWTRRRLWP